MTGQNGAVVTSQAKLQADCGGKKARHKRQGNAIPTRGRRARRCGPQGESQRWRAPARSAEDFDGAPFRLASVHCLRRPDVRRDGIGEDRPEATTLYRLARSKGPTRSAPRRSGTVEKIDVDKSTGTVYVASEGLFYKFDADGASQRVQRSRRRHGLPDVDQRPRRPRGRQLRHRQPGPHLRLPRVRPDRGLGPVRGGDLRDELPDRQRRRHLRRRGLRRRELLPPTNGADDLRIQLQRGVHQNVLKLPGATGATSMWTPWATSTPPAATPGGRPK